MTGLLVDRCFPTVPHTRCSCPASRAPTHRPSAPLRQARRSRDDRGRWRQSARAAAASEAPAEAMDNNIEEALLVPILQEGVPDDQVIRFPAAQGVYAVYDSAGACQFIGISRQIASSVGRHYRELPDLTHSIRFAQLEGAERPQLTAVWQSWLEQTASATGTVPAGNQKGNTTWMGRRPPKGELKLTPGKGLQDLTCSVEDLLAEVVKENKVVAFIKGTRTQPQCGFSYKVLSILGEAGADFEVVNVLDETFNPGVREAIKTFSQWPTIPQLYIKGEFVGGADIVEELNTSGELKPMLTA